MTADSAISLACRVRCFGLPLYNAIAREAPALRLGLLPFLVSASDPEQTLICAAPTSAFGGKADMTFCYANVCEMNVREATPRALDRDQLVGTNALGPRYLRCGPAKMEIGAVA